ncbi:MAG TPA: AAA family ATPase, partial [Thermoplasmata archaeon]|nr:AAA family ATPase [Thermoplasmata archaeon]
TDGQGRTVDFRNALIIMTSNLGTDLLSEGQTDEQRAKVIDEALHSYFRPEFLNRLDDVVTFRPLSREEIERIVDLQIALVQARLKDRRIEIRTSEAARKLLAAEGFDAEFGARPLKRTIQRLIVDPLTVKLLSGDVADGAKVTIEARGGDVRIAIGKSLEAA